MLSLRVLLVNPPCRHPLEGGLERYFVRAGCRWPFSVVKRPAARPLYTPFPFFMAYTAALLEADGFEVRVDDAVTRNATEEEFLQHASGCAPDVIISETSTPTIAVDLRIARTLKERTGAVVVLVGPHVSTFPGEILAEEHGIDYVLVGEYEESALKLLRALREGVIPQGIDGVVARSGELTVPVDKPAPVDLSRLPYPARHHFPLTSAPDLDAYWDGFCQYRPAVQVHASRGCPFRCNFCLWTQVLYRQGQYRTFDAVRVVDEMEHCVEVHGAREIYFDDDIFTGNRAHVLEVCEEIRRRGLGVPWSCMADAAVTDRQMVEAMADAGCIGFKFGVESADPELLKRIGKPHSLLKKVHDLCSWLASRQIKSHATFTFGLLGETTGSMERTFEFACDVDVDMVQFSITTPFPGTRYFEELETLKLAPSRNWDDYDGSSAAAARFDRLAADEVVEYARSAHGRWLLRKLRSPAWLARQARLLSTVYRAQGLAGIGGKLYRGVEALERMVGGRR